MTDRLAIGGNAPPEPIDPIPALAADIADLVSEADSLTAIETEEQAEAVRDLLKRTKASAKAADDARVAEKEPHLLAGRDVDERFKPVIASAKGAQTAVQAILTPWEVAQKAIRDAAAQKLRDDALALQEAAQKARASEDLQTRIDAEQLLATAAKTTAQANKLDKAATGLRTFWEAELHDPLAFGKWARTHANIEYLEFLTDLAGRQIRTLKHNLPGCRAIERKSA